jgi:hypothetical protein
MTVDQAGGVKYGLKWWLYPYGKDNSKYVWAGSGFGGQLPLAFPEYDMVVVVTSWNIKTSGPRMTRRNAMDLTLGLIADKAN